MRGFDRTTENAEEKQGDGAVAAAVRAACVQAALDAYETARMDGLCHEGAWEAAVSAMRMLDVDRIAAERATDP